MVRTRIQQGVAAMLWLVLSAGLCACGGSDQAEPNYEDALGTQKMHIGAWVAPPPAIPAYGNPDFMTLAQFQAIADSGITVIYDLYNGESPANTLKALNLCSQVGIRYYARDFRINQFIDEDPENIDPAVVALFDAYRSHSALAGHLVVDEPGSGEFADIAKMKAVYETVFPGKDFYVNLFPSYASTADTNEANYADYLDKFLQTVQPAMLSYDAYPLMGNMVNDKTDIHESLLMNLEMVAVKAQAQGIPFWKFVQTMGFGLENRALRGVRDMAFQVYVDMAYGSRGIQHFCYWTPLGSDRGTDFMDAMIDPEGNKTDNYTYAQVMNHEIQKFEHVFLSFDWTGTILQLGKNNSKSISFNMVNQNAGLAETTNRSYPFRHTDVKSIEADEDAIMGTYRDADGNPAFLLVNYSDPGLDRKNIVTVKFRNVSKALVYVKGEKTVVTLKGNSYTVELGSGEGVFIIPFQG